MCKYTDECDFGVFQTSYFTQKERQNAISITEITSYIRNRRTLFISYYIFPGKITHQNTRQKRGKSISSLT